MAGYTSHREELGEMRIVGLVTAVIVGAIFFWGLLARENEIAEEKALERKVGQAS